MALYLNPPSGRLSLSTIDACAKARLHFLLKVSRCHGNSAAMQDIVMDTDSVKMADCLTEGAVKDKVSHFVLRLACSGDPVMADFFVNAELNFFKYRVSCMTEPELLTFICNPLRNLGTLLMREQRPLAAAMLDVAQLLGHMTYTLDLDSIVHYFIQGRKDKFFVLRFEHVPELVAKRVIKLCRGKALVPCTRLCEVLCVIFAKVLGHGMEVAKTRNHLVVEDERFSRLFLQLKAIFYRHCHMLHGGPSLFGLVSGEELEPLVEYFPLCMSRLHHTLCQRHRLKHADRIQYTLYLKELGMPVHEALQFWRLEYSQEATHPKDAHDQSWHKNARRYTYSIRHLYGLEGKRVNYRGHSCTSLQRRSLGPLESGGCPFSHCDTESLRRILTAAGIQHQNIITSLAFSGQPSLACQAYLMYKATTAMNTPVNVDYQKGTMEATVSRSNHPPKRKMDCACDVSCPKKVCQVQKGDENFADVEESGLKPSFGKASCLPLRENDHTGQHRSHHFSRMCPADDYNNSSDSGFQDLPGDVSESISAGLSLQQDELRTIKKTLSFALDEDSKMMLKPDLESHQSLSSGQEEGKVVSQFAATFRHCQCLDSVTNLDHTRESLQGENAAFGCVALETNPRSERTHLQGELCKKCQGSVGSDECGQRKTKRDILTKVMFYKPVEYSHSYKKLLQGLQK